GQKAAVDTDTVFAIGSNTKEFTAASLAILVDEGKLLWDDRVMDYLPDFRMLEPYGTRELTIRDLFTNRSGLRTAAGGLMFVTLTDFTRNDLLHGLRYLKPASSFRSRFAYDNLLYVIAGEVVAAVSGQSWEDFVTARILKPVHMDACAADDTRLPRSQQRGIAPCPGEWTAHETDPVEHSARGTCRRDQLQHHWHGPMGGYTARPRDHTRGREDLQRGPECRDVVASDYPAGHG